MQRNIKHFFDTIFSYLFGRIIEKTDSEISPGLEVAHINGKIMLNSMNANYSYGMLQKVFELEFEKVDIKNRKPKDVLILGFGAGSIAFVLLKKYKMNCNIIGVEKDKQVILLGEKYFNTKNFNNTEIICADAFDYIMDNKKQFDLVIVDVYVDSHVPEKIESEQFISHLKQSLNDKGLMIFNKMICDKDTEISAKILCDTFSKVMGKCEFHRIHKHNTNLMLVHYNNTEKSN